MAESLLQHKLAARADLAHVEVDSAGTSGEHDGEEPDRRTRKVLEQHGISRWSRSRRVRADDFERFDYIIAMDTENVADLMRMRGARKEKVSLATAWDGSGGIVPDPWYGGIEGFHAIYRQLDSIGDAIVRTLSDRHGRK